MKFTKTQQRIWDVLSDGRPHTTEELRACLLDDQGEFSTVKVHVSMMRSVLRPTGVEIMGRYSREMRGWTYTIVSLIALQGIGRPL